MTAPATTAPGRPFADELAARVTERESQIVLGIDPDPMALWAPASGDHHGSPAQRAAAMVLDHCRRLIDAAAPACVAAKLQLACFERFGASGWQALQTTLDHAHEQGLLVIADGKRGDISVSSSAYAQALLGSTQTPVGTVEGLGADALTVNPLMGADALAPFVEVACANRAGLFALVRTSNPGAADVEDLRLAGGETVWEALARIVDELGAKAVGETGLSDIGAVLGATVPEHLARARELMPRAVFLLPGVGAQGGSVDELAPAFAPHRAGGLVTASRSIAGAYLKSGKAPELAAREEAERLRAAAWALA
ncbi:MAG TPA: orotidine-5'-phosphate decarboxylase [Solirubrobacteraceae bacterium]